MPGIGIDSGDHPVRGDLPGDPPPAVGAIGVLDRFDVLAGDQRQQRHRLGSHGPELLVGQSQQPGASPTSAVTNSSRAAGSSQAIAGFPGWS